MEMNIEEQLSEKRNIIAQMREMSDKLYKDGKVERDFTAEEKTKYNAMEADLNKINAAVQREQQLKKAEDDLAKPTREGIRAQLDPTTPEGVRATPEYKRNFITAMRYAESSVPLEIRATLQKAVNSSGGFVVPIEFETAIVQKMYDANLMRQLASVIRTTSQVNIPMEGNLPTFGWIDELGTYPATDTTFGQNILGAYKLGGIITVSEELMMDAFIDIADYLAGRSGLSAGFAEEAAYFGGDGNKKPTGVMTTALASSATVTSATNNNTNSIDMYGLMYGLSRPYRKNASFVVADTVISKLRQEKSTTGQYLWTPSLTANAPDIYLGKPIYTSDFLPALAAGSVSAIFGDFSYYQIVDRVGWSMQRLNELYAATGQIGFRMWERTDGKLLRPEAVITLTTHA